MAWPRISESTRQATSQLAGEIQAILDVAESASAPGGGSALGDPGADGIVVRTAAGVTDTISLVEPAAGLTITNPSGVLSGAGANPTFTLANDLAALEALTGTGFPKRTGTDTWSIGVLGFGDIPDLSATYLVRANNLSDLTSAATARTNLGVAIGSNVQAWDADLDAIAAIAGTSGLLKKTAANTWGLDTSTYLTANQTISFAPTGDVTGSTTGTTTLAPALVIGAGKVTSSMLASGVFANPTAPVGLTAVNGTATTAMRSDGAPALSVSISPTWLGNHTFANPITITKSLNNDLYLLVSNTSSGASATARLELQADTDFSIIKYGGGHAKAGIVEFNSDDGINELRFSTGNYTFYSGSTQIAGINAAGLQLGGSTSNLLMKDSSTGFRVATTLIVTPQANNAFRSTSYTSGLVGWSINASGSAEFDNVDIRGAIHAGIFTYNAINVTAGTQLITPSGAKLKSDVTVTASPTYTITTFTIDTVDQDGLSHAASQLFAVNDVLRLKDGLVGDTWFKVTAVSDQATFWRYTASIQAGTANVTYRAGLGVPDYKQSGAGSIVLTADQINSPYIQMATHAGTFSSADASGSLAQTPQARMGNLNSFFASYASDIYGLAAGQQVSGKAWFSVDPTNGVRLGSNTTARVNLAADGSGFLANSAIAWDTAGNLTMTGNAVIGGVTIGNGKMYIGTGTYNNTNTSFYVDSTGQFSLKDKLSWNGTTLSINGGGTFSGALSAATGSFSGAVTASSGSITGPLTISGASGSLAFGITPPTSASAGTGLWLDRTGLYSLSGSVNSYKLLSNGLFFNEAAGSSAQLQWQSSGTSFAYEYATNLGGDGLLVIATNAITTGQAGTLAFTAANFTAASVAHLQVQNRASAADVRIFTNGASPSFMGLIIGADAAPNATLDLRYSDSSTNSANAMYYMSRSSSGTVANGFGTGLWTALQSSTTVDRLASAISTIWTTATDATRTSAVIIQTVNAGSLTEVGRFAGNGDFTITGLLKAGSGPATLTDAAGKILSTAFLTTGTPQFAGLGLGMAPGTNNLIDATGAVNSSLSFQLQNTTAGTGANTRFMMKNDLGSLGQFGIYSSTTTAYGALAANTSYFYSNVDVVVMADGAAKVIKLATGGNAASLTVNANASLTSSTGATLTSGGIWTNNPSWRALKDDITKISNVESRDLLNWVRNEFQPVRYRYKNDPAPHLGFLLDDMPKNVQNIVTAGDPKGGISTKDSEGLLMLLVKELAREVQQLKNQLRSR